MCCRGLYGLLYQKISIVLIFFWAAHQRMLGSYKYTWAHSGSSVISRWRTHVSASASLPHGQVTRFGLLPYIYWDSNLCPSRLRFWGSIGLDVSWLWNNVGCVFVLPQWLNGLEGCMFHLQWLEADQVVWLQELCLWEKRYVTPYPEDIDALVLQVFCVGEACFQVRCLVHKQRLHNP